MSKIPFLTTQQMIEVDRLMIDEFGIQLIQMMENAGRHLADLAVQRFLEEDPIGKSVVILAGIGGNGGGALVCARNLHNWGADVVVVLTKSVEQLTGVVQHQTKILQANKIEIASVLDLQKVSALDLIVDGLIGYSIQGAPRGLAAELIRWANQQEKPILALDLPSGLDGTTGEVFHPAIKAAATLTLALPKIGLQTARENVVGELYLADIGVPPLLYAHPSLSLQVGPIFSQERVIRLF
ncbi:MAG: NAD(P)H-hydrate epimerase [Anaerolineales bacterium]|nr:NAD(P)H-hydrate epimerase [Anaerolineales bacterium]